MWLSLANNVCTFYRRILNSFLFKQPRQTPVATRRATLSKNSTSNSSNLILIDSMLCNDKKKRKNLSQSFARIYILRTPIYFIILLLLVYHNVQINLHNTMASSQSLGDDFTLQTKQKPQNKTFSMNLYLCFRLFCYMLKL